MHRRDAGWVIEVCAANGKLKWYWERIEESAVSVGNSQVYAELCYEWLNGSHRIFGLGKCASLWHSKQKVVQIQYEYYIISFHGRNLIKQPVKAGLH